MPCFQPAQLCAEPTNLRVELLDPSLVLLSLFPPTLARCEDGREVLDSLLPPSMKHRWMDTMLGRQLRDGLLLSEYLQHERWCEREAG